MYVTALVLAALSMTAEAAHVLELPPRSSQPPCAATDDGAAV